MIFQTNIKFPPTLDKTRTMKVIVTIKRGNKDANAFCKEIDMTLQECDNLIDIVREINHKAQEECISAYVHQI